MPYALCPMPYALCPIVPHLSEKGYMFREPSMIVSLLDLRIRFDVTIARTSSHPPVPLKQRVS
jgi:hypothetical protein